MTTALAPSDIDAPAGEAVLPGPSMVQLEKAEASNTLLQQRVEELERGLTDLAELMDDGMHVTLLRIARAALHPATAEPEGEKL